MTILYLTFYFTPDLCPGSFRNAALVTAMARQLTPTDVIHVVTTQPNRYQSFNRKAPEHEDHTEAGQCRVIIDRVSVPTHASGLADQVRSFWAYFRQAHRLVSGQRYDLVFSSSSRLFTAFLGAKLTRKYGTLLFLDVRDLFREAVSEMIPNPIFRFSLNLLLRAVERYTFGRAQHINLVSAGFKDYFSPFAQATYSYFPNGIDEEFLSVDAADPYPELVKKPVDDRLKTILYAGNIGQGQGLHKIIPQAAQLLGNSYRFLVIGDGGAINLLTEAIRQTGVQNVTLRKPISRRELIAEYTKADYLFVHLNDWKALRRVLPSKIMEYGATNKPILAGVTGYAAQFIHDYLPNSLVFTPGNATDLVQKLRAFPYQTGYRDAFRERFQRRTISTNLARKILAIDQPIIHLPTTQPVLE